MDNITKETFKVILTYEMSVNTDTGEILESKLINREVDNSDLKPKKSTPRKVETLEESPTLILEDNKYILNRGAVALMQLVPGDKIDIKYDSSIPVIGKDEAFNTKSGNKLTKSFTVAYRGTKHDELSKYGNEFKVLKHPSRENLFILKNDLIDQEATKNSEGNEDINTEEIEDDSLLDFDIDKLVDSEDTSIDYVDSNVFNFN